MRKKLFLNLIRLVLYTSFICILYVWIRILFLMYQGVHVIPEDVLLISIYSQSAFLLAFFVFKKYRSKYEE